MLSAPRYLLGVAELGLLAGFATLGAARLRARLLPRFSGAPAHLATAVLALALLLWAAELLGTFGWLAPLPYVVGVALAAVAAGVLSSGESPGRPYALLRRTDKGPDLQAPQARGPAASGRGHSTPDATPRTTASKGASAITVVAMVIATAAVVHFAAGTRLRLTTGMTGFDSTWYHGPFAAGFFQSGDTWNLHFIAPQFLAWFYPANSEVLHAIGMLAFGRDVVSPLLNLGWFAGCLLAAWCIGRPFKVAPFSLALAAVALSVPALSDQAGEARNDVVGIFFLLAAVAIALNAGSAHRVRPLSRIPRQRANSPWGLAVSGLAAGLAAGTKLNFLLPAAVLVLGLGAIAPRGARLRSLLVAGLGALAGGVYWYLRNLAHSGNPLPWVHHLGPISLPAPEQALGGREGHSVLGYLGDGSVWSDWFLPGLHHGLWAVWPLLAAAALAGLLLCLTPAVDLLRLPARDLPRIDRGSRPSTSDIGNRLLVVAGLTGLAALLAWLIAPTSASGPDGMPRGFESGLRYLAPALVLGLALLPAAPPIRERLVPQMLTSPFFAGMADKDKVSVPWGGRAGLGAGVALVVLVVAVGYPVQRHYLRNRYSDPSFTAPGLDAAFKWARAVSGARIATTSTRQYPLFGTDLSNHVDYVGVDRPHGGFTPPSTCRTWRRLINAGHYDYVVTSRDRLEPGKPPYPATAAWTAGSWAKVVLRVPPTIVYQLKSRPDPTACR